MNFHHIFKPFFVADFFNPSTEAKSQHSSTNEPNLFENFNESSLFDSIAPISSTAPNQTSPTLPTTTASTAGSNSLGDMDLLKELSISSGDSSNNNKINMESILGLYNSGLTNNVNKLGNMAIPTQPTNNMFNQPPVSNVNLLNHSTGMPLTHSQPNPFGVPNPTGVFGPTGTYNKPNPYMTQQPYNTGASNDIFGNLNKFAQPTKPAFNQNADLNSIFANNLNAFQNQHKSHAHIQPASAGANIFSLNTQPTNTNAGNNDLVSLWD